MERNAHRTPPEAEPMSPTNLPAAVLQTILSRLAALFLTGAGGEMAAARQAAAQMIGAYNPQSADELRLAANIVCFSFQALEALSQATDPDMPLPRVMRLRGGAVSLSRESAKAERRLTQLQKARNQALAVQPAETRPDPAQPEPKIEKTLALIEDTGTVAAAAKAKGLTWTQAYAQRQRDSRLAASRKKAEARAAAQVNPATPAAVPDPQTHGMAQAV